MICKSCGQDKKIMARGLCSKCYHTDIEVRNSAVCSGCKEFKPIKVRGLCQKCYARFQRHGDTSWGRKKKSNAVCSYCKKEIVHAKGFCKSCYGRFLRTGSPERKRRVYICRTESCNKVATYNGYCDEHNNQAWNKEKAFNGHLMRKYDITINDYEAMLKQQNCVCAICGEPETKEYNGNVINLAVDHCHHTGKVRGLLCNKCNVAIGGLRDSLEIATKAVKYLEKHK